jgi:hypothetical protein
MLAAGELPVAGPDSDPDTAPFWAAGPAPLEAFAVLHAPSVITVNANATIKRVRPKGVTL